MRLVMVLALFFGVLFGGEKMSIYDFQVKDIDGHAMDLQRYKGRVMLIVNVASQCGFTPQYAGLEELNKKYKAKGLSVLGFPCNQFLGQEPKAEKEIKTFCSSRFGVSFDMFSKIEVNGKGTHPLYQYLKKQAGGALGIDAIKWNFTKFLVDRHGKVVARYAPSITPQEIDKDIKNLL